MVIENKIDYSQVINMIKEGLFYVMDNDELGSYDNLQVLISNEQFFIKKKEAKELQPNTIYIVVKFAPAAVDYGVTVLPISIIAVSEQNHCDLCQRLLQDFTTMANMEANNTGTIQQFYESPSVSSNFNEMCEGFRSVIAVSGTFVISESANPFTLEWFNPNTEKFEEVYFVNGTIDGNFQNEPKLFYNTNNYTKSITTMGTITFNISSVLLTDDGFYDEMLKYITQKNYADTKIVFDSLTKTFSRVKDENILSDEPKANVNKNILFKLTFRNGQVLEDLFKISGENIQQVLKKIPMVTLVFTN